MSQPTSTSRYSRVALALAVVVWTVVVGHYRSSLGLMADDWLFITSNMDRGAEGFLMPYAEHILILFGLVYRSFLEVFGLSMAAAFNIFAMFMNVVAVVAVFMYLRRLVGDVTALIGALVLLFLGASYDQLLWSFQSCFALSIAAGIGGLILLRREGRFTDLFACLALSASVMALTLGLSFAAAALLAILLADGARRRIHVSLIPLGIFCLWYLGWGTSGEGYVSVENLIHTPVYVLDAFGYSLRVMTGTFRIGGDVGTWIGRGLAVAALLAIGIQVGRRRQLPASLLVGLAAGITFWGLAGLNQVLPLRTFDQSRYQFPSVVFTLMILGGGFEGVKLAVRFQICMAAVAVAAIWINCLALADGYRDELKPNSDRSLASVISLDLMGPDAVDGSLEVPVDHLNILKMDAASYFAARDRFGSGLWNVPDLMTQDEAVRTGVDQTIRSSLPFPVEEVQARPPGTCHQLIPGADGKTAAVSLTGKLYFASEGRGALMTGRFTDGEPFGIAELPAKWVRVSRPPGDHLHIPWRISAIATRPVTICSSD
ncbi:MAG: hypothetical protein KDB48_05070 [Solirubrobacterales bacterium]|nr:hypothetical protein [Solirubrobacterales bacterium]